MDFSNAYYMWNWSFDFTFTFKLCDKIIEWFIWYDYWLFQVEIIKINFIIEMVLYGLIILPFRLNIMYHFIFYVLKT